MNQPDNQSSGPPDPLASSVAAAPAEPPIDWNQTIKQLGAVGPLALAATLFPVIGLVTVLWQLNNAADWLRSHADMGLWIYIGGFAVLAGIALLPTHAAAILGGWTFGFANGFPATLAGFFGGAIIGYLIASRAAGQRVVSLLDEHKKWRAVYDALLNSGFLRTLLIVALIRLPPNSPFAISNLVLASTRVPWLPFLLGTLIGMAPRIALVVWMSSHAATLDLNIGKNKWIIAGGIVLTLIVLAIIGTIAKHAIDRVTNPSPKR